MQQHSEILGLIVIGVLAMLFMVLAVIVFVILYYQKSIKTRLAFEKLKRKQAEDRINNITEAQESERRRISAHLHDEVGASLSSVNLLIGRIAFTADEENKVLSKQAGSQLNSVITEIRKIVQNLSPTMVERFGFMESVGEICKQIEATGYLKTSYVNNVRQFIITNKSAELILYRIIQELTNNVVKHAEASRLKIDIYTRDENMIINVIDNGIGLRNEDVFMKKSLGLSNIKSRVEILNGIFDIKNNTNGGTIASISVPIEKLTEK